MRDRKLRIVLVDDHPFILMALTQLIAVESDFELVGEAVTGVDALRLVHTTNPDIVIVDVGIPKMNGLLLARKVGDERPETTVIILTGHEDEAHVKQAIAAGARGYVVKRSATEILVPAIRAVAAGGTFVDPLVARFVPGGRPVGSDPADGLSEREREVLKLYAAGYSNKEIAARMMIGIKSVDTYRSRGSQKLGLRTRADIVRFGLAQGWLA
ncbi:MAG: response regulator transcription factor [Bradyrhizobium sp.]|nr:response regulator transcription factor [Bradyrhizobium sp.]